MALNPEESVLQLQQVCSQSICNYRFCFHVYRRQITVKTGAPFVMQNVNGTMTKVYTEPVPTTFSKDQLPVTKAFLLKNITDWPTKLREM